MTDEQRPLTVEEVDAFEGYWKGGPCPVEGSLEQAQEWANRTERSLISDWRRMRAALEEIAENGCFIPTGVDCLLLLPEVYEQERCTSCVARRALGKEPGK